MFDNRWIREYAYRGNPRDTNRLVRRAIYFISGVETVAVGVVWAERIETMWFSYVAGCLLTGPRHSYRLNDPVNSAVLGPQTGGYEPYETMWLSYSGMFINWPVSVRTFIPKGVSVASPGAVYCLFQAEIELEMRRVPYGHMN